jgi:hypothetical protein
VHDDSPCRITCEEFKQTGLLRPEPALLGHEIAVDGIDRELGEIATRGEGHVFQYAVGVLRIDSFEKGETSGVFFLTGETASQ